MRCKDDQHLRKSQFYAGQDRHTHRGRKDVQDLRSEFREQEDPVTLSRFISWKRFATSVRNLRSARKSSQFATSRPSTSLSWLATTVWDLRSERRSRWRIELLRAFRICVQMARAKSWLLQDHSYCSLRSLLTSIRDLRSEGKSKQLATSRSSMSFIGLIGCLRAFNICVQRA